MNFLKLFKQMLFSFAVAEEGAGAGGAETEFEDFSIDDPKEAEKPKEESNEKPKEAPPPFELDSETKEILAGLQAFKDDAEAKEAVSSAVSELTKTYPNFDINQIGEHLREIAKTDIDKANSLNNPHSWELLYQQHFHKPRHQDGDFDAGRSHSAELFDFDKAVKEFDNTHSKASRNALFDNSL